MHIYIHIYKYICLTASFVYKNFKFAKDEDTVLRKLFST